MTKTCTLTYELNEDAVDTILANGLADTCGFDNVDFEEDEFQTAKKSLIEEGQAPNTMYLEMIQARMLFLGYKIRLHMAEEREDEEWYGLTLDKIAEGINLYLANGGFNGGSLQDIIGQDPDSRLDFYDYDAILQYACYGKVLIG